MFSSIEEAFVEPFQQQNHEQTYSPGNSLINKSKENEATAEAVFCEKGHKYDEIYGGKCHICESGKFQDYPEPHRITNCKTQPELKPTDCSDGQYFFKTEKEKKEIYDTTKDRELNTGDFCKPHEPFGPKNCLANTYLVSANAPKLRTETKDRKLTNEDYCEAQPAFESITCSGGGLFENRTLYDEINAARERKATAENICSSTALSSQKVEVHHTHFDEKLNKRSFRTLKVTGKVNNAGKVSLKPTAQREIKTMNTPQSEKHRTSSSAWNDAKNGEGCNDGNLDKGGWCSKENKVGQWYQLDIENETVITGIVTQGRNCCNQWVKTYKVMAKKNEGDWFWVDDQNVYNGNFDQNTKVISDFKNPIVARYIRIYPQSWNRHMSMRCDVRCANLRAVANAKETTVNVGKNAVFNITRTEPTTGLYYFDIIFTDAYRNRATKIGTVQDAYLYDFQFSLNRHAQHVRKGSDNYSHPNGFGENIGSITSSAFKKNSVTVQNIKYTAKDLRSDHTLEQVYKATVYTVAASIKAHANQNTMVGNDHHAPEFSTTNMTVKYIGGMPGKDSVKGNAHTYTGHYEAIDNYDAAHKINLHPKVTKYKFSWPTLKDIRIRVNKGYHWHHHFSNWGVNAEITHAQYNWAPHHNINNDWVRKHVHDRHLRFHARNKYNHGQGKWYHVWVRVYNATASIKAHANQNTKYGHNHHTPQFNTTNMTVKYIGGMPGKHSIRGNAHTYTGHYQAVDNYDSSYKINLHPKVTKYKHAWPTVKNVTIRRYQGYHWHHNFSSWGINCTITHAQCNWHPYHNIDNNWVKNHIHHRTYRFHARNNYNHGEGKWLYANVNVLSDVYRVNVRAYVRHKHYGAGNVNCDMQIRNHHDHHFATCHFNTHHAHQHKPWCAYDIKHGQRMRVTLNGHCHGEENYSSYAHDQGWVSNAKNITQHVDIHNAPAVKRKVDADIAAANKRVKDALNKQRLGRRRGTVPKPSRKPARTYRGRSGGGR